MENNEYYDVENALLNKFDDKKIRRKFIIKVYCLLVLQLLITFGCSFASNLIKDSKSFYISETGQALFWVSLVGMFMIIFSTICYSNVLRSYPVNYLILFLFTIFITYQVSMITIFYNTQIVISAFGITFGIVIILTIYAFQTKYDFTDKGGYLLAILSGIILTGIINIFIHNTILNLIISTISAIIFSCFIVYDTQLIVGGKHQKHKFEIDDYVLATMSLYLDIINFFLNILSLLDRS
jgi:FtsH-binding integral membrane protein